MFATRSAKLGTAAGALGLVAVLFGILWMTVIFSSFEVIPSDLSRIVELEGEYTVVDQEFLVGLQSNQTIAGLLASPDAGALLGSPAVGALLSSPAVPALVGNPAIMGLLRDPAALAIVTSPLVASLLTNADLLAVLSDPATLAALSDPASLPALAAHPVLGPVLADPAIVALLLDPTFQAMLAGGAIGALAGAPALLELLANPAIPTLLANPAIQSLLADPAALGLILDPRTQAMLANPADAPTLTFPVLLHRERVATGTDGGSLFLNEQVTTTNTATGGSVPGFDPTDVDLVVDRSTKEYLAGSDEGRTGQWGLPFHVDTDRIYDAYISAARAPLPISHAGEEDVLGLATYRYVVDTVSFDLGVPDPVTGLPLVVDAAVTIWVEPVTGSGVNAVDLAAVSVLLPSGEKHARFIADLVYTDDTVAELVADAKSSRDRINRLGMLMPWLIIVVGGVLLLGGVAAVVMAKGREPAAV